MAAFERQETYPDGAIESDEDLQVNSNLYRGKKRS
jgi:hypothetical protein